MRDINITYVPHGINKETFHNINTTPEQRNRMIGDYDFVLFWNNRNLKRKHASDVIFAFYKFVHSLPFKKRDRVLLLLHTDPIDEAGTDLYKVLERFPGIDVQFSVEKYEPEKLNLLYNLVDVVINISGMEGFGLGTAEALMTGTPIITLVTGGLQDQIGLELDGRELTLEDYKLHGSFHDRHWKDKLTWGEWVTPIWPITHSIVGSTVTPYLYEDFADIDEIANAIRFWYDLDPEERKRRGNVGLEWIHRQGGLNSETLCYEMGNSIEQTINNFKPKDRYELIKIN